MNQHDEVKCDIVEVDASSQHNMPVTLLSHKLRRTGFHNDYGYYARMFINGEVADAPQYGSLWKKGK